MSRAVPRYHRINAPLPTPTPNKWEVIVRGLIEGQMTINTFYYDDQGAALSTTSESNLAGGFITANWVAYRACLSSDWTATDIQVKCLTDITRATYINTTITGNAGTGPAGHEPTYVAAVLLRLTKYKGQCGRGRIGLPAVPTSWVTASTITTATAYTTLAALLTANFVAGGTTYVNALWSRGPRPSRAVGAAPLTQVLVSTKLGTVRRRKLGRGR